MTFYAILGIPPEADDEAIRSSYKTLVRRYHPDVGPGSSPEEFRRVVEAYETLIDPERRKRYDRSLGYRQPPQPVPSEPMSIHPEPITDPRLRYPLHVSHQPPSFDELFEDLFRHFDDVFRYWP